MIHCDDYSKHDRLLTFIWLFEYRNTGTRVLIVHDEHTIQGPTIHISNDLHGSQFNSNMLILHIYIIDNSRFKNILA